MIFPELHIYFCYNKEDKTATRTIKDGKGNIVDQCTSIIFSEAFENDPVRALEEYLTEDSKPKQWTVEKAIQQVKEGEKPLFIGFSLSAEQYEELLPYINDSDYLAIIQSRVEAE